jgi:hypothetical protein
MNSLSNQDLPAPAPDGDVTASSSESVSFDLRHDALGQLVLVDAQGTEHVPAAAVRDFPISDPDHWISILDSQGRELACVDDLAALPPRLREILEHELARREFVPIVKRIVGMPPDTEPTQWEVETDRGRTRFVLNTADDVRHLGAHRALIIDSQGIRYLIQDLRQLDALSRRALERYL